jgi:hypothetical protein
MNGEIFSSAKDYSEFNKNHCRNCKEGMLCSIRDRLARSYFDKAEFPSEIQQIDGVWKCEGENHEA